MYHHIKKLMYTVNVGSPDPRLGNMLLEQFGGANGELAAAMQYSVQGLNCDDPGSLLSSAANSRRRREIRAARISCHASDCRVQPPKSAFRLAPIWSRRNSASSAISSARLALNAISCLLRIGDSQKRPSLLEARQKGCELLPHKYSPTVRMSIEVMRCA
jgi:hypothetical protein